MPCSQVAPRASCEHDIASPSCRRPRQARLARSDSFAQNTVAVDDRYRTRERLHVSWAQASRRQDRPIGRACAECPQCQPLSGFGWHNDLGRAADRAMDRCVAFDGRERSSLSFASTVMDPRTGARDRRGRLDRPAGHIDIELRRKVVHAERRREVVHADCPADGQLRVGDVDVGGALLVNPDEPVGVEFCSDRLTGLASVRLGGNFPMSMSRDPRRSGSRTRTPVSARRRREASGSSVRQFANEATRRARSTIRVNDRNRAQRGHIRSDVAPWTTHEHAVLRRPSYQMSTLPTPVPALGDYFGCRVLESWQPDVGPSRVAAPGGAVRFALGGKRRRILR